LRPVGAKCGEIPMRDKISINPIHVATISGVDSFRTVRISIAQTILSNARR
jgi:hypothetical protein